MLRGLLEDALDAYGGSQKYGVIRGLTAGKPADKWKARLKNPTFDIRKMKKVSANLIMKSGDETLKKLLKDNQLINAMRITRSGASVPDSSLFMNPYMNQSMYKDVMKSESSPAEPIRRKIIRKQKKPESKSEPKAKAEPEEDILEDIEELDKEKAEEFDKRYKPKAFDIDPDLEEEAKPVPEVDNVKDRDLFYQRLEQLLSSQSTRDYRKFKSQYPEYVERMESIMGSQKWGDFYPTPEKCLSKDEIVRIIKSGKVIYEPTAGLGNMVNFIYKHKSKSAKVMLNELNKSFIPTLEQFYPDATITNGDFFDKYPKESTIDTIICNPPFSIGNDKKAYLDFLLYCIYILSTSKSKVRERKLVFICPTLHEKKQSYQKEEGHLFDFMEVIKNYTPDRLRKIVKDITGKTLSASDIKNFKEDGETDDDRILDDFTAYQSRYLGECSGFAGTGVKADIYDFVIL